MTLYILNKKTTTFHQHVYARNTCAMTKILVNLIENKFIDCRSLLGRKEISEQKRSVQRKKEYYPPSSFKQERNQIEWSTFLPSEAATMVNIKKNRNKIYFKFQNSGRLGKYEKNSMTSRVTIKSLQKCLRFIMLMIIHTNQS